MTWQALEELDVNGVCVKLAHTKQLKTEVVNAKATSASALKLDSIKALHCHIHRIVTL
jgi:hypothetical protein